MKPKLYTVSLFVIFSVLLFSCKTAEKLYQRGRYDEAVELATKKLAKKPNDASLIAIVQDAYRYAVTDHESRIRTLSNSNSDLRFEEIYHQYGSLQRLYESIRRSPSVYDLVKPTDYSDYLATYKEEAGNAREDRGDELMGMNDKRSFREAFYEFQRALNLKPGDLVIKQKMDDAFAGAVTYVVVNPLVRYGLQYSSYQFDYNNFNRNMLRYLEDHRGSQFLQYYSSNERNLQPDFTVDMRFSDVNIGRYRDDRTTREVSKQVVVREIVHKKDSVTKEYATVKARITITTRTIRADGLLQAMAKDVNNTRVWSDTYRGEYGWTYSFATFTGDERALSDEDKRIINRREEWPPSNDEIITIIMNEIQNKAQCGISDYFNRYI